MIFMRNVSRPKYRNRRVEFSGRSFASGLERDLYAHLRLLEKGGEVSDIKCQPHVFLTDARIEMIPDYSATCLRVNELVYWEAKGFETDVWRIKRKLWTVYGPGRLRVYKGRGGVVNMFEEIIPKGRTLS